jgi:tRNA G37 N-methylase Trm5
MESGEAEPLGLDEVENSLLGCLMFDHVEVLESFFAVVPSESTLWNWRDAKNRCVLHLAAKSPKCMRQLLTKGGAVLINCTDAAGITPLTAAVLGRRQEVIDLLVATPKVEVNAPFGEEQETALQVAVDQEDVATVQKLMNVGGDPTRTNVHGESAFDKAQSGEMFEILASSQHLAAALFSGAESGNEEFVNICLKKDEPLNLNCVDNLGRTALMIAAARDHVKVVQLLLTRPEADIDVKTAKNRSALLYAVNRNAEETVKILLQHGASDLGPAISEANRQKFEGLQKLLVQAKKSAKKKKVPQKPLELVKLALQDVLTAEQLGYLPRKWHVIGHVLMLQDLDESLTPHLQRIGDAYLNCSQIQAESAVVEMMTPHGELRVPTVKHVAGRPDTLTRHVEDGVKFWIDPTKVMFSSGNGTERMHFHHNIELEKDDIVVDMFAGIGYFTIPMATANREVENVKIFGLEKNPDSANFLRMNAKENRVDHLVVVEEGDNREMGKEAEGKATRVLMGYIPTPVDFISRALQFLCKTGGIIHYHYVASKEERDSMPQTHMEQTLQAFPELKLDAIINIRLVKNFAPKLFHFVGDVRIVPSPPINP